jgi:formylmethanofuran dehydrogenase subunit E
MKCFMGKSDWQKAVEFHGHACPGLAIGFKAVEAVKEKMGVTFSWDEELVCVTENDACGVDAVQVLTGCSFGKGNLIYRDTGKQAFSFFNRKNGESLRMIVKPFREEMDREKRQEYILNAPVDEIFDFKKPFFDLPEPAIIFTSIVCESCGESAAEHKMRLQDGKKVCLDCFKEYSRGW